jgi:hypothetical protein
MSRGQPNQEASRIAKVKQGLAAPKTHLTVESPLIAAIRAGQLITPEEWNLLVPEKMEEILKLLAQGSVEASALSEPDSSPERL